MEYLYLVMMYIEDQQIRYVTTSYGHATLKTKRSGYNKNVNEQGNIYIIWKSQFQKVLFGIYFTKERKQ